MKLLPCLLVADRYEVLCVRSAPQPLVGVYSVGEDGLAGTADDIKSWNHRR